MSVDDARTMIIDIRGPKVSRIRALNNLRNIALFLGEVRTRDELIPYTLETPDHDVEAQAVIATQLGQMWDAVGAQNSVKGRACCMVLFNALRQIAESDDPDVQRAVVEAFAQLSAESLCRQNFAQWLLPTLLEMVRDTWHPLRVAGAAALCRVYVASAELDEVLSRLSVDSIVVVRRAIASHVGDLAARGCVIVAQLLSSLAKDAASAVTSALPVGLRGMPSSAHELLVATIRALIGTHWQTRAALVVDVEQLLPDGPADVVGQLATGAAAPGEQVVSRCECARRLGYFARILPLAEFMRLTDGLSRDSSEMVRGAVGAGLEEVAGVDVSEVIERLLSDPSVEVGLKALRTAAKTGLAVQAGLRFVARATTFASWRSRLAVAELLPAIMQKASGADFGVVRALLADPASDVRDSAVRAAQILGETFGKDKIVPLVVEMQRSTSCQLRRTAAAAAVLLGLEEQMLRAVVDPVPNVRLVLAIELPRGHRLLAALGRDSDPDVVAASQAR